MSLHYEKPMTAEDAKMLNPLQLAYIGDTVWDLLVRTELLHSGKNLRHMHEGAVASVNAHAQSEALARMDLLLSDEEKDIVRRGRNTHSKHPVPKHQDPADYASASALEALMGYLYVTGQEDRICTLFRSVREEKEHA